MQTSDYLEQLQQDREDLVDNLETKGITGLTGDETFTELVPEVLNIPSGTINITSIPELNQNVTSIVSNYNNYLISLVNNYNAYTNNSITLYTPDINCKNYMIQKKNDGTYRIVWGQEAYIKVTNNQSQGFRIIRCAYDYGYLHIFSLTELLQYSYLDFSLDVTKQAYRKFYYSNDFSTLENLLQELQNPTSSAITYTAYNSRADFAGVIDNDYPSLYTNCLMFNNSNEEITNGRILSHNETIVLKQS